MRGLVASAVVLVVWASGSCQGVPAGDGAGGTSSTGTGLGPARATPVPAGKDEGEPKPDGYAPPSMPDQGLSVLVLLPAAPPKPLANEYNTYHEVDLADFGQDGDRARNAGKSAAGSLAGSAESDPSGGALRPGFIWEGSAERLNRDWARLLSGLQSSHSRPEIRQITADLLDADASRHEELRGMPANVLLGHPIPPYSTEARYAGVEVGMARDFGMRELGRAPEVPQIEAEGSTGLNPEIRLSGPEAEGFVVWLRDGARGVQEKKVYGDREPAVALAVRALRAVLQGDDLATWGNERDPQMEVFDGVATAATALAVPDGVSNALKMHVGLLDEAQNERFAVVKLRVCVEAAGQAFGVVHGLVVLRADKDGAWRVLKVVENLPAAQQARAYDFLVPFAQPVKPEQVAEVGGISQAAPVDGDDRAREPDFWWDNKGGARLQVVEWQSRPGDRWLGSQLFFVPDSDARLHTQVRARFAKAPGTYRWRVWSVGVGGVVVLSGWRRVNVFAE